MENIKKSYKNNKFKISAPTWNQQFQLSDKSYSLYKILKILKITLNISCKTWRKD